MDTVPFTQEAVKAHIDGCIVYWRQKRDQAESSEDRLVAECNVDTYQSMRSSIFGEILPLVRKFTIKRTYAKDDVKFMRDEYEVELTDESGKVVMCGDWYHDQIDDRIRGFFEALDYLGIAYETETVKVNHPDY